MTLPIILCADDFAMTDGISRAIEQLVSDGRLSATSALVTGPHWPSHGLRLAALRPHAAIGLHLNLTLGAPLAAMPRLAADGRFPAIGPLMGQAVLGRLDVAEITHEFARQLQAFEAGTGHEPDFVDGHQHVHALPTIRQALMAALTKRSWRSRPLIRNPSDRASVILRRRLAIRKSLILSALATGFGAAVRQAGFATNHGFSGVSDFALGQLYREELRRALAHPGALMLVMCHPGFVDAELESLDPITIRRRQEFDAIAAEPGLANRLWHPDRSERYLWPSP